MITFGYSFFNFITCIPSLIGFLCSLIVGIVIPTAIPVITSYEKPIKDNDNGNPKEDKQNNEKLEEGVISLFNHALMSLTPIQTKLLDDMILKIKRAEAPEELISAFNDILKSILNKSLPAIGSVKKSIIKAGNKYLSYFFF